MLHTHSDGAADDSSSGADTYVQHTTYRQDLEHIGLMGSVRHGPCAHAWRMIKSMMQLAYNISEKILDYISMTSLDRGCNQWKVSTRGQSVFRDLIIAAVPELLYVVHICQWNHREG